MSARVLAALFATFLFSACAQTQGETCQLEEDCEGDLLCCKPATAAVRGTCQSDAVCRAMMAPTADGSVPDAGSSDAGPTLIGLGQVCHDAGHVACAEAYECERGLCVLRDEPLDQDAGSDAGQDAGSDAGDTDAGGTDAGQDAGLDAGA